MDYGDKREQLISATDPAQSWTPEPVLSTGTPHAHRLTFVDGDRYLNSRPFAQLRISLFLLFTKLVISSQRSL